MKVLACVKRRPNETTTLNCPRLIEHPYRVATRGTGKYWSSVKYMLNEIGLPGGYMRPPLLDLNEEDRTNVMSMCKGTGLIST